MLLRARNAGLTDDGVRSAVWEPIITQDEYDALKTILTDPQRLTHGGVSRKLVGAGIFRCGDCGRTMRSGGHNAQGHARYTCTNPTTCIRRIAAPIDDLVREVVAAYLRREGMTLLRTGDRPDVSAERARLSALRVTARELPGLVGAGIMTVQEFRAAKDRNSAEIAALEAVVERAAVVTPLVGIADDADDAGAAFLAAKTDRQRAVIAELVRVTILRAPRGRAFNPDTVRIIPRDQW